MLLTSGTPRSPIFVASDSAARRASLGLVTRGALLLLMMMMMMVMFYSNNSLPFRSVMLRCALWSKYNQCMR